MINKEDWERALKQFEDSLVNSQVNENFLKANIKVCVDKIAEYPDEDPKPEDLKEMGL